MRAAIYESYGPPEVVHLADVPTPVPKDNEVLVRVRAATVSTADWRARSLELPPGFGPLGRLMFGVTGPRRPILGTDLAGEVAAIGRSVTRFRPGDEVIAYPGLKMGAHAEYKALAEDALIARKPANLDFAEAVSLLFGGMAALDFFRRGPLRPGDSVLVNGASGAVGVAMVQLAKAYGASSVTAVASARHRDFLRGLGVDAVVDYTREDFARNGQTYDVIIDTVATAPFARAKGSLRVGGRLFKVLGTFIDVIGAPFVSIGSGRKVVGGTGPGSAEDLRAIADLAAAGKFRPVIERTLPLSEIVEAHRIVDRGHKRGAMVVTVP